MLLDVKDSKLWTDKGLRFDFEGHAKLMEQQAREAFEQWNIPRNMKDSANRKPDRKNVNSVPYDETSVHAHTVDTYPMFINETMSKLSELERQVIIEKANGESYRNMEKTMGKPKSTLNDTYRRAVEKIKEEITELYLKFHSLPKPATRLEPTYLHEMREKPCQRMSRLHQSFGDCNSVCAGSYSKKFNELTCSKMEDCPLTGLVTIKQYADAMNMKEVTVYKYCNNNKLPTVKKGKNILIDTDKIEDCGQQIFEKEKYPYDSRKHLLFKIADLHQKWLFGRSNKNHKWLQDEISKHKKHLTQSVNI